MTVELTSSTGPLSKAMLDELSKSCVSEEVAVRNGLYATTSLEASKMLKWKSPFPGFGHCLVFEFFDLTGRPMGYRQVKPETPRLTKMKDGKPPKPVKYESVLNEPSRLYFPADARQKLLDPACPVLLTEGCKKALCAAAFGYAAVALAGVDVWSRRREKDPGGKPIGKRVLLPDFDALKLAGRVVYVVFDSDIIRKKEVEKAEASLLSALQEAGAKAYGVRLPESIGGAR